MSITNHPPPKVKEYVQSLVKSERLGSQVVFHTVLPEKPALWSNVKSNWSPEIRQALKVRGIRKLYQHQVQAIELIQSGRHVVVATPTASGKTLIYNLPTLEKFQKENHAKSLYIFPLKALAQDQLRAFERLAVHFAKKMPTAAIYDGDTSAYRRKRIREAPPNVILTNPDMLHLSFLAHHRKWQAFFKDLKTVVIDEVHTYRGVMGSHVAQIFRRLQRLCQRYGAAPTFIFSSATVANPARLAGQLTGLKVAAITESGAPRGKRHLIFINPETGPAQTGILLLKAALHRNLRTIVYTQSRKMTELIAIWAGDQTGDLAERISAYRAGFLPEERREIEARLARGELLAVISTSALELGIDIGDLDLCLLVGYPGSVVSTWQRGGRVGRSGQDSALILIAGEDALDQFFMRNPENFINREPESAVVNPYNLHILAKHLECAAAELPLKTDEPWASNKYTRASIEYLEKSGLLLRSADGGELYARRKLPHREVDIRGTGNRYQIVDKGTGKSRGEIDEFRAFRETHPGAIYLHRGDSYIVDSLDLSTRTITVVEADVDYYTQVRGYKEIEILDIDGSKPVWGTTAYTGKIKLTDQVTEYEIRHIFTKKLIKKINLDLPPQIFETESLWFRIPRRIYRAAESGNLDFMGGIHAMEHAAIGIFPLLVLADRNDLGGLSTLFHPQLNSAAVFIYDGIPGGAGINRETFSRAENLLENTRGIIAGCACDAGCPSCVHSPKCGSGNRPIDKQAAIFILDRLKHTPQTDLSADENNLQPQSPVSRVVARPSRILHYGVFDLETQRSAAEVGGWHRADLMKISCAVLYDSKQDRFIDFMENRVGRFIDRLQTYDLVIGFNIKRFDYQVLKGYSDFNFQNLKSLDILEDVKKYLDFRLSLAHLASATLGESKSADGLQALQWWQEGRILEIIQYCRQDVKITRDLYRYGRDNGHLIFKDKQNQMMRIAVDWQ
ncbi:ATP-dependent RNA helicase, DEAD/DEAH box family [Olavius sp. associated proteobacterium Delta 1]|nr:ATP-dependent RNA helicase, DEAD/DEAH box family [Olavius sp. associated proteobacterium Delta 1]